MAGEVARRRLPSFAPLKQSRDLIRHHIRERFLCGVDIHLATHICIHMERNT